MTDVKEQETVTVTEWKDNRGNDLAVGDRVYVAVSAARSSWDLETTKRVPGRDFDFGEVEALNEDGTVSVWWDSAGCSCDSANGPAENTSDLSRVPDGELGDDLQELHYLAEYAGYERGRKQNQRDLRDALGLPHPDEDKEN